MRYFTDTDHFVYRVPIKPDGRSNFSEARQFSGGKWRPINLGQVLNPFTDLAEIGEKDARRKIAKQKRSVE
jgi:hypothetical protein